MIYSLDRSINRVINNYIEIYDEVEKGVVFILIDFNDFSFSKDIKDWIIYHNGDVKDIYCLSIIKKGENSYRMRSILKNSYGISYIKRKKMVNSSTLVNGISEKINNINNNFNDIFNKHKKNGNVQNSNLGIDRNYKNLIIED